MIRVDGGPTGRIRIAVVYGGRSGEHPVSCLSAASIVSHLDRRRFEVVPVKIDREGYWLVGPDDPGVALGAGAAAVAALDARLPAPDRSVPPARSMFAGMAALGSCDVVLPAIHGPYGEDGSLQSCLVAARVPYVGCPVAASALAMDKDWTKKLLTAAGLTVAASAVLRDEEVDLADADRSRLGLPVFVKPARGGSSLGVTRVADWDELPAAVAEARRSDRKVLVEAAVPGREIDIGVLERPDGTLDVSPPLEIEIAEGAVFDFHAKYEDPGTVFVVPAELDPAVTARMQEQARTAFRALGCAGLLRVDFFLRPDGVLVLNEVNTFPGFTSASQYPLMWRARGLEYGRLLDVLVDTALAARPTPVPGAP